MFEDYLMFEVEADYINTEKLEKYANYLLDKGMISQYEFNNASDNEFSDVFDIAENIQDLYEKLIMASDMPDGIKDRMRVYFEYSTEITDDYAFIYFDKAYEWEMDSRINKEVVVSCMDDLERLIREGQSEVRDIIQLTGGSRYELVTEFNQREDTDYTMKSSESLYLVHKYDLDKIYELTDVGGFGLGDLTYVFTRVTDEDRKEFIKSI